MGLGAERGFGLLEAIVALVLISVTVMAAYDWINTNLITIRRIQDVARQTQAKNNIRAYLANINPMQNPQAQRAFVGYTVRWHSRVIQPERDQINGLRGIGLYRVAMYEVIVQVQDVRQRDWFNFTFDQVGYRKVHSRRTPF